eukprot:TRINITY_DN10781_c0_g1_i1.p1 TRINITY_DN10781_c0_g1~~TRINITY_DN10781_c0_g1_i1.p1  ORF type:complete len:145 (+),score=35.06 TRINITY_DN10781_c0_g1_i1:324-758(+)
MHTGTEGAKSWDTGLSMYLSSDFFETKHSLSHGNNFVVVDHRIFVAAATSMSAVELWVSSGSKFHKTKIPIDLPHRGYGILNTQDGSVLLSVRSCLLYTSDAADDLLCVDLGGRRIIKKKKNQVGQSGPKRKCIDTQIDSGLRN